MAAWRAGRRVAATLALAALLVVGAAGLSGHLALEDCLSREGPGTTEGTATEGDTRYWPPGFKCVYHEPIGTEPDGRFVYGPGPTSVISDGSVAGFLGTLAVGGLLWLLVARTRPHVPRPLRLAAITALAFAGVGVGSYLAGLLPAGVVMGLAIGVPLGYLADRGLRPGRGPALPIRAGPLGMAVAVFTVSAAAFGTLFDLGLASFAIVLALIAAAGAVPSLLRRT